MPEKSIENKKKTILVVEDRENWRTTFCNLLSNLGYNALQATCGKEFRENAGKADVIILDISMPMESNGEDIKTAGLDVLIELQQKFPDHPAIQNPIIRSMWDEKDFAETKYTNVRVKGDRWCSRHITIAELLSLIESTPND